MISQLPWHGSPECPAPPLPLYHHFLWEQESQWVDSLAFCLWRLELESSKPLAGFLHQGHPSSHETTACFLPGACNPSSAFLPSCSAWCLHPVLGGGLPDLWGSWAQLPARVSSWARRILWSLHCAASRAVCRDLSRSALGSWGGLVAGWAPVAGGGGGSGSWDCLSEVTDLPSSGTGTRT